MILKYLEMAELTKQLLNEIVDFVYKEVLNEFLTTNGNFNLSTFYLINWEILIDEKKQNEGE